jgi:hypothetical protein
MTLSSMIQFDPIRIGPTIAYIVALGCTTVPCATIGSWNYGYEPDMAYRHQRLFLHAARHLGIRPLWSVLRTCHAWSIENIREALRRTGEKRQHVGAMLLDSNCELAVVLFASDTHDGQIQTAHHRTRNCHNMQVRLSSPQPLNEGAKSILTSLLTRSRRQRIRNGHIWYHNWPSKLWLLSKYSGSQ